MTKKNPAAVELGKRGGRARASQMSPEERAQIARKAAGARWEDHEYSDTPGAVWQRVYRARMKGTKRQRKKK
jgi:hypothetical protein